MSPVKETIHFAQFLVTSQTFYVSSLSAALVNLKPILPGHSLVISRRVVGRFADLSGAEVADLFCSVQKVGKVLEKAYQCTSLTIAVQDGTDAGQTVPHVHVHVIPRKAHDYKENDEIYNDLERSEGTLRQHLERSFPKIEDKDRIPRTDEDMAKEAAWLARFFQE